MSDKSTALISAMSGLLGVLAGAVIAVFGTVKVAEMQLAQAALTTRASSALSMRSVLAEKAAPFFVANEEFQGSLGEKNPQPKKIIAAANKARSAISQLYPYVDADLLAACYGVSIGLARFSSAGEIDRQGAFHDYADAYKKFQLLYLRLRRELEKNAQVEVISSQIDDSYKK